MDFNKIRLAMANMKVSAQKVDTAMKAASYRESFGNLATKLLEYSKRVLQLEGVESPEEQIEPTTTDLVLARALAEDVRGNGWEGSGQGIMKMFSIILGRNLFSKEIGLKTRLALPKGTLVKHSEKGVVLISEGGNTFKATVNGIERIRYVDLYNTKLSLPTEEETILFLGQILGTKQSLRTLSSTFELSSAKNFEDMLSIAENGLDVQLKDKLSYKTFMAGINPDLTTGFGEAV